MITREQFKTIMQELIDRNEKIQQLNEVNSELALAVTDSYSLQDTVIHTLDLAMNLPVDTVIGSSISWWIYDTDFGKNEPTVYYKDGDKEECVIIDTLDKLYDLCVREAEENGK